MQNGDGTRINKYLSEVGICSRREADRWIEQGRITVNGKKPSTGAKVKSKDEIRVDGRVIDSPEDGHVYLVFNKPVGVVTTTDTVGERDSIISYINYPRRIFPVGRLDKPSEGLIFLTSDGDIVNQILRAGNNHEKEYEVTVNKPVTDDFITKMASGVPILGQVTKKCKVERAGVNSFKITLVQGLNRQIRRMCEHFDYEVLKLKRLRIMHITLDLPPGQFRDMTDDELRKLFESIKDSSKTAKKGPQKKKKSTPPKGAPKKGFKPKGKNKGSRGPGKSKSGGPSKKRGGKRKRR